MIQPKAETDMKDYPGRCPRSFSQCISTMVQNGRFAAFAMVTVCLVAGCSSGQLENPDWPKRYPTSGTVNYKGQPVEGAEVTFISTAGNSTGVGKTDSDGRFYLTTYVDRDGVVAGPQAVAIRRVDVIDKTPEGVDLSADGEAPPPEINWIIPEHYSNPGKSGLDANVTENGPNEFTFDLQ